MGMPSRCWSNHIDVEASPCIFIAQSIMKQMTKSRCILPRHLIPASDGALLVSGCQLTFMGRKPGEGLESAETRRMLYSDTYAHKLQPICARPETPRALSSVVRSSDKGFRRAGSCAWEVAADESGLHERARTRGQVVQEDTMLLLRHTCCRDSAFRWSCLFLFSFAQGCSISGQVSVCLFSTSSIIYETNLTEGA